MLSLVSSPAAPASLSELFSNPRQKWNGEQNEFGAGILPAPAVMLRVFAVSD
jgi:hypothetical protein